MKKTNASAETSSDVIGVFSQTPSSFNAHNTGSNATGTISALETDRIVAGKGTSKAVRKLWTENPNHLVKKVNP